ncbi:hypothetical protein carrying PKD domains [Vibrio nigripulchritudo MADA3029]|uniref:Chitinase n=1 Tax=Vibrio nigripulchritudo SOn1 TaxID=1238450 RepID=A0AAV2VSH2_9VIBR|nr:PKD domain-containing protein [Vibrio nigripulchritudo]EGU57608.1 chitinase [Vibrio nigripulchritudo ATCC 27043]CCN46519.1 hypothetical protein carrying PKD domains [Vibrio nigripulchritudo MADA3020]CCN53907.1 hypothetical protein carrying PKD domains [Vibrio nigripulchritudo MADA3021]CCN62463.1 hypothetical protein carrying PKD domains [Vibrio nigripulchritudo MADA3029]CCO47515.1 hypothetical protein carrying PKD domains [Vibrio nigripulchritudo SOn1]
MQSFKLRPLFVSTLLATMTISTAHAANSASTTWPGQEVGVLTYQLSADKLIKTGPIRLGQMDFNISEAELDQIRASAPDQATADKWVEIAILKRKVWRAPYSFVIPNERPHWAMAMAHAAQLFKNVTGIDDPFHSANLYAAKTLQESAVGADYDAKTFTYPTPPKYKDQDPNHSNYGIWSTLHNGRTKHDGFFQLEGHMYSAYGEMMRMFPNRFYKGIKPDSVYKAVAPYEMTSPIYNAVFKPEPGKNSFVPSAIGASYYNIFAYYILARSSDDFGNFVVESKDPLALTKLISVGYNRGLSPNSMALNPLKPEVRAYCASLDVIDECFDPENQGGFGTSYLYQVPYKTAELNDVAENNGPGYPGYYTSQIDWPTVSTYLDALAPLYTPEEIAAAKASSKVAFDAIAKQGSIDFANQFGAVLDAILLSLPVDTPWTQLCKADGGAYDAFNRDGTFKGVEHSYRCKPEHISKPLILGTRVGDRAPVARAGEDQVVSHVKTVTLDGSRSFDPDGDAITYAWKQVSGTPIALTTQGSQASFDAPLVGAESVHTFQLAVTANGKTGTDNVIVTLRPNQAPVISYKPVTDIFVGDTVTIDASKTLDPDGDVISYRWSGLPDGSVVNTTTPTISFKVPAATTYNIELAASDSFSNTAVATIPVLVELVDAGSTWDPNKIYQKGDVVRHRNKEYTAQWHTENEEPGVAEVWLQTYGPEITEWDPKRIYGKGDRVLYNGATWEAKWYANHENVPGVDGAWKKV